MAEIVDRNSGAEGDGAGSGAAWKKASGLSRHAMATKQISIARSESGLAPIARNAE